jgi:hypothetical protein
VTADTVTIIEPCTSAVDVAGTKNLNTTATNAAGIKGSIKS